MTNAPFTGENVFLQRSPENKPLPSYEQGKSKLPRPYWEGHDDYIDCYNKAWQLAFGNLRSPAEGSGFVSNFIDTAFNGCIFMWDSSFMLMFGKYGSRAFNFQGTLDNFYSHQHRDGFICREIREDNGEDQFTRFDPSSTGPDILPWCEWEYFLNTGDKERLANVFPPLMAYHGWMRENRTWLDGTYWSSGWGCGMDNLPRVQEGYSPLFSHGHMVWVDACLQELMNCNILTEMGKVLGREKDTADLALEKAVLEKVINEKLWDEKTGFYYDLWKNGELSMVKHIGAYWALIAGAVPAGEKEKRFVAHLDNEKEFKRPNRVPALSMDDPRYNPDSGYWAGGVWAPTDYMVLSGLDNYGEYKLAYEIASDALASVISVFRDTGTLFENYAPEFVGEGGKPWHGNPSHSDFVGWSGLFPISIMLEHVFGIKPDAEHSKITWYVGLCDAFGVDNYPFGEDGVLSFECKARRSKTDKPCVEITSNIPVTVELVWDGGSETLSVGGY